MAIRVFIVDDHLLFRTGLRALLAENGVETVGDAGDAGPALQRIATLQPDVVLMDLSLPGMSGVEATERLSELAPDAKVLILTVTTPDHRRRSTPSAREPSATCSRTHRPRT